MISRWLLEYFELWDFKIQNFSDVSHDKRFNTGILGITWVLALNPALLQSNHHIVSSRLLPRGACSEYHADVYATLTEQFNTSILGTTLVLALNHVQLHVYLLHSLFSSCSLAHAFGISRQYRHYACRAVYGQTGGVGADHLIRLPPGILFNNRIEIILLYTK